MKLDGLRSFVMVADVGSISAGARRLNLSKSVVSERLAELERSLGTSLMHRTTRSLSLTEDGQTLYASAVRILGEAETVAVAIAERRGGLAGPLRLSVPLSFGITHLGPALYPFLLAHPKIDLSLDLDDRFVDVAADGYDAAVRIGQVADSRLVALPLTVSRRTLVASPAYLAARGQPTSLDQLNGHKAIVYANRGADGWTFQVDAKNVVVHVAATYRFNNGDVMRDAVEAGLGLALLPTFITYEAVKSGRLITLDVGASVRNDVVHLVYPKTRGIPSKVAELGRHLRRTFGDQPYWDGWLHKAV